MDEADWPAYRRSVLENIAELNSQLRSTRDELGRARDELAALRLEVAVALGAIKVKMGILSLIGGSAVTLVVGYMINKLLT
jgi:hypothetical protein